MSGFTGTDFWFPLTVAGVDFSGKALRADLRRVRASDPVAIAFGSASFGLAGTIEVDATATDTIHFRAPFAETAGLEVELYYLHLVEEVSATSRVHIKMLEVDMRQGGTRW